MSKPFVRTIWIVAVAIAVVALVAAGVVCSTHAGHDEPCRCPLCLAWLSIGICLPVVAALVALRLRVHRNMECTRATHTRFSPVLLAVKLNC